MSTVSTDQEAMRGQLLDAAEQVFYARGIQAANMSELRTAAELPLRRIYQLFPSKDELVVAFLRRRHDRMMGAIEDHVADIQATAGTGAGDLRLPRRVVSRARLPRMSVDERLRRARSHQPRCGG